MAKLTRASYYVDWVTIPFLGLGTLIADVLYHGLTVLALAMLVFGLVLWTFAEYATHRWLFHRVFRREHWIHHIRPSSYDGVPAWQSNLIALLVLGGCIGSFGLDAGAGLFAGIAAGYVLYIWAHDRFHHFPHTFRSVYWQGQERNHEMHHKRGIEANFGVVTPAWDMLLGTFQPNP
jgi:sterol desaturase/sphingolipid hydroxylase (fatty acid hydroxylase superfamily)